MFNESRLREEFPTQQEVADYLEKFFPEESPEDKLFNDNWGLYSKFPEKEVRKILLCTTATEEVVDYFLDNHYDLLISHHDTLDDVPDILPQIIYHSTMDQSKQGHNHYFVRRIGLQRTQWLRKEIVYGLLPKPMSFDEFKNHLERSGFHIEGLVWKSPSAKEEDIIRTVVYCSGGGGMLFYPDNGLYDISKVKADVFVTGELGIHPDESPNKFKYIIELSHTTSEKPLFKWIQLRLLNKWKYLQVDLAPKDTDYFGWDKLATRQEYKQKQLQLPNWDEDSEDPVPVPIKEEEDPLTAKRIYKNIWRAHKMPKREIMNWEKKGWKIIESYAEAGGWTHKFALNPEKPEEIRQHINSKKGGHHYIVCFPPGKEYLKESWERFAKEEPKK